MTETKIHGEMLRFEIDRLALMEDLLRMIFAIMEDDLETKESIIKQMIKVICKNEIHVPIEIFVHGESWREVNLSD